MQATLAVLFNSDIQLKVVTKIIEKSKEAHAADEHMNKLNCIN